MISVAIVTARRTEHTSWDKWYDRTRSFLRGDWMDPVLVGEWGALLAALHRSLNCFHMTVQLRSISMQTIAPKTVIVVHREGVEIAEDWDSPMYGAVEVEAHPALARGELPLGNADKNQAIDACRTEYMIMLDDCCIPSFAFVELAREVCSRGNILLPEHWKIYLPNEPGGRCSVAKANVSSTRGPHTFAEARDLVRRVGGIWAMPTHIAREVRYSEALDGKHGLWDEEFLMRLDKYVEDKGIKYEFHPRARVYEIEHDRPWLDAGSHDTNLLSQPDWEERVRAEKEDHAEERPPEAP